MTEAAHQLTPADQPTPALRITGHPSEDEIAAVATVLTALTKPAAETHPSWIDSWRRLGAPRSR